MRDTDIAGNDVLEFLLGRTVKPSGTINDLCESWNSTTAVGIIWSDSELMIKRTPFGQMGYIVALIAIHRGMHFPLVGPAGHCPLLLILQKLESTMEEFLATVLYCAVSVCRKCAVPVE